MDDKEIHVIDNLVRSKMHLLDNNKENFFSEGLSLITDYAPYRDRVVIGKVMQSPEHRIIYVKQGCADIQFNMKEVTMNSRKMVILPKGSTISVLDHDNSYHPLTAAFTGEEFAGLVPYQEIEINLSAQEAEVIESFFGLMKSVLTIDDDSKPSAKLLIKALLTLIHSSRFGTKVIPTDNTSQRMNDFLTVLNTHYDPLQRNIGYYANLLGLSVNHLSSIVRAASGKTVMDWVNTKAILEINLMLGDGKLTIAEIAQRSGFCSTSQFDHYYRRHTQTTPNDYRRLCLNEKP